MAAEAPKIVVTGVGVVSALGSKDEVCFCSEQTQGQCHEIPH